MAIIQNAPGRWMSFCQKYDLGFDSIGWMIHEEEVLSSARGTPCGVKKVEL